MSGTRTSRSLLLTRRDPTKLAAFAELSRCFADIDVDGVITGDVEACRAYVEAWHTAKSQLWSRLAIDHHDLLIPPMGVEDRLDQAAAESPYRAMILGHAGSGKTSTMLALLLLGEVRDVVRGGNPVLVALTGHHEAPASGYDTSAYRLLRRLATHHGSHDRDASDAAPDTSLLDQIRTVFGVNNVELAELFGVTPTAIGQWDAKAIPAARVMKAVVIAEIADILSHRIKSERVPGIARKQAAAYGGRTMLEVIADDDHEWLLRDVRASFDYSRSA